MLFISLEKFGYILGDLMCSVYIFRINLRLGKIWMIWLKLFVDDLNSIIVDIINIVLMGGKV